MSAALAMVEIDPQDEEMIEFLIQTIFNRQNNPPKTRALALEALKRLDQQAMPAMDTVEQFYEKGSISQQIGAVEIAAMISPQEVPDVVVRASRDLTTFVRVTAIETLGKYSPKDPLVSKLVIKSLDDPRWEVRRAGRRQLIAWGTKAKHLLPQLVKRLPLEEDLPQRNSTAYIIRVIETGAQPE